MNLQPPPETDDIKVLKRWCDSLYEYLKYPTFYQIRFVPRSDSPSETSEGVIYYDSDDSKLKCHNDLDWQNTY